MSTIEVVCLNCNKTFDKRNDQIISSPNHFCSRTCAAIHNNKKFPKRKLEGKCKNCGNSCASLSIYCSNVCYRQAWVKRTDDKYKKGKISSPVTIKKHLKEYYDQNCCSICNQSDIWNGLPLTLQLDHIDGNSDNNLPENLRLLCPNCHTQTDTFSSKEKKNTKRNRYLRKFKGYSEENGP